MTYHFNDHFYMLVRKVEKAILPTEKNGKNTAYAVSPKVHNESKQAAGKRIPSNLFAIRLRFHRTKYFLSIKWNTEESTQTRSFQYQYYEKS